MLWGLAHPAPDSVVLVACSSEQHEVLTNQPPSHKNIVLGPREPGGTSPEASWTWVTMLISFVP